MFNCSKYTKTYYKIIGNAKTQNRNKSQAYFESHHVIPKSLGGNDKKENRVLLTFREHFICHQLLCRMVSDQKHKTKMLYALYWLKYVSKSQQRNLTPFQIKISLKANREASKTRNHKPTLGMKHTEETKNKLRIKSTGRRATNETKVKISLMNQKTNKSRAEKVRAFQKGKPKSKEHRKNMSIAQIKAYKKRVGVRGIEPQTRSV